MSPLKKIPRKALIFSSFIVLAAGSFYYLLPEFEGDINSDKYILNKNVDFKNVDEGVPIIYWKSRTYSGQFYTNGKATEVKQTLQLDEYMDSNKPFYLMVRKRDINDLEPYLTKLKLLGKDRQHNLYWVN